MMLKRFIFIDVMFASYLFETVFRRRVAPDFDATGNLISIELIAQVCLRKKILKIIQVVFILILILDTQDLCKLIFRYVMLIKLRRKKEKNCQLQNPSTPN